MAPHHNLFGSITPKDLVGVHGGASRVTSRSSSSDQLTTMLTQITSSIQNLSNNKNQTDPMTMMMMMMMMGGGGGGGAVAAPQPQPMAAPPPAPAAPVVNISTSVRH